MSRSWKLLIAALQAPYLRPPSLTPFSEQLRLDFRVTCLEALKPTYPPIQDLVGPSGPILRILWNFIIYTIGTPPKSVQNYEDNLPTFWGRLSFLCVGQNTHYVSKHIDNLYNQDIKRPKTGEGGGVQKCTSGLRVYRWYLLKVHVFTTDIPKASLFAKNSQLQEYTGKKKGYMEYIEHFH